MFRFVIMVLAVFGIVGLLGGNVGAFASGVGALFLLPFLFIGMMAMVAGCAGSKVVRRADWGRRWQPPRRPEPPRPSAEDRFEEWHRMAHAREEVDRWVEHMPDTDQD